MTTATQTKPQRHGDKCEACGRKFFVPTGSAPTYGPICRVCLAADERERQNTGRPTAQAHFYPQPSDVYDPPEAFFYTDVRHYPQACLAHHSATRRGLKISRIMELYR